MNGGRWKRKAWKMGETGWYTGENGWDIGEK